MFYYQSFYVYYQVIDKNAEYWSYALQDARIFSIKCALPGFGMVHFLQTQQ